MNNELERAWKEVVVAQFGVLFWNLPEGTEEKHKKPSSGQLSHGQHSNRALPKYKSKALPLEPTYLVT
jgi:hypothetical protein